MSTMEYKGYTASVEYDDEAGILYGHVLYMRDGIDFQADSVSDLKKEFQASVEDYLEWCAEIGEAPERPFSGKFLVRIEPQLHRDIAITAARDGQSLNEWVKQSFESSLERIIAPKVPVSRAKGPILVEQSKQTATRAYLNSIKELLEKSLIPPMGAPPISIRPEPIVVKITKGQIRLTPRLRHETINN